MKKTKNNDLLDKYHDFCSALLEVKDYADNLGVVYENDYFDKVIKRTARDIECLLAIYEKDKTAEKNNK